MNNLLKAMGFWMWGLIAIGISVSLVSVSYRMVSVYRAHSSAGSNSSIATDSKASPALPPLLFSGENKPAPPVLGSTSVAASHQRPISRVIGKEMTAAQSAMQPHQWPEALKNLEAAEAKSPLTLFDSKTIEEFKAVSYVRLNNLKAAQTAYEAALSSGAYKEEELARVFRLLFQLATSNQQYAKAIEYGKQASDAGASADVDLQIMSQLYFQQKDCKNSGIWGDKAIAALKKSGAAPKEVLYQIKLQCASDAGETAGMIAALYDLVRLTNKTSYWNNLIRLERQEERDDHNTLMIYRVMYDTNSMQADTDYIEMAQLLGDAGLPGEAQMVLEKATSSGILKDDHKERTARLLAAMKTRADADRDGAPQSKNEPLDSSFKSYVTAMRGRTKYPDDEYIELGRKLMAENKPAEAREAFGQLKTLPNISPRVVKLWNLYADTIPEAPLASL